MGNADAGAAALVKRYLDARDPREAERAFADLRSAAATSPRTALACGVIAAQVGTPVHDVAVAQSCLEAAAAAGLPEAQHALGALLFSTAAGDRDKRAQAERWLAQSSRELPESVYLLATLRAESAADPARAKLEVTSKLASAGYAPAQFDYARAFLTKGDTTAARSWLEKAATQGHGEAAYELSVILDSGPTTPADRSRATALREQAIAANVPRALYELGLRHLKAQGVDRDTEKALALFRRGAASGDANSQYAYAYMLMNGVGTGADESAAVEWMRRAAAQDHLEATYSIGNAYANGWGVGKSMDMAYKWYCRAAQRGHPRGTELLSRRPPAECPLPAAGSISGTQGPPSGGPVVKTD